MPVKAKAGAGEDPQRQTGDLSSLREGTACHSLPPRLHEAATGNVETAIDADTEALREMSDPEPNEIAGLLEHDPVMSLLEKRALARLLSCAIIKRLPAGAPIFASGEPAAELIFVITGMIEIIVPNREAIALEGSRFGDEAALATGRYAMSARTRSEAMLVVIQRPALTAAVAENTAARNAFEIAVLDRLSSLPQKKPPRHRHLVGSAVPRTATLGWLLTLLAPIAILLFVPRAVVGHDATSFLAILSAVICLWGFGLVEEFIPGLFLLCAVLAIGIVPPAIALSGFSSDGFFMTLGILVLGGTISSSGLSYRLLLWMLAKLPTGQFWQNLGMMVVGTVLTPLIPSTNGRVAMVGPFAVDMIEALGLKPSGVASARLATTAFISVTALSSVFMTGKPMNLVVHSLLPPESRDLFQWTGWLAAAAVSGVLMIALNGLVVSALLRGGETASYSRQMVQEQIRILGKPQPREWAAAAGIMIFAAGVLTTGLHKIPPAWVALAIPCGLLMLGLLHKREFRDNVDWPLLLYTASLVGLVNSLNFVGLDGLLSNWLIPVGTLMKQNFTLFLGALFVVVSVLRLAIPTSAATVMTAAVMLPIAREAGISPWVVGFAILNLVEFWFFPFQCSYYLQFRELVLSRGMGSEGRFLLINAISNIAKFAALALSEPVWHMMGLLR